MSIFFPWIKQYENVDLSVITEEFYAKNNLPYIVYDQAKLLETERNLVRKNIKDEKKKSITRNK